MKMSAMLFELGPEILAWTERYQQLKYAPVVPVEIGENGNPVYEPEAQALINEFRDFPRKATEHFLPKLASLIATREAQDAAHFRRELVLHLLHSGETESEAAGLGPQEFAKVVIGRAKAIDLELRKWEGT